MKLSGKKLFFFVFLLPVLALGPALYGMSQLPQPNGQTADRGSRGFPAEKHNPEIITDLPSCDYLPIPL